MLTVSDMKDLKKKHGYSYAQLSALSGIPLGTLQKALNGTTASPRFSTLQALSDFFENLEKEPSSSPAPPASAPAAGSLYIDLIREGSPAGIRAGERAPLYHVSGTSRLPAEPGQTPDVHRDIPAKQAGKYTLADYYALPDPVRAELINGVFYDMASPTIAHQELSFLIHRALDDHLRRNRGSCKVYSAPTDVRLFKDDKTIVQPDVLVVCDRDKRKDGKRIEGAPDLIVEVLSDSTRKKDLTIKLEKYMQAGVREYWIVDPAGIVVTFDWTQDGDPMPKLHESEAKIPVAIWGGACIVDFEEIFREAAM